MKARRIHGDPKVKGQRGFGYKKSLQKLKAPIYTPKGKVGDSGTIVPTVLPPSIDLRSKCPPVCDQGPLGTCTAFATGSALWYDMLKQGLPNASELSELFIYYISGVLEGDPTIDSGRTPSDVISALASEGAPPESDWPYDTTQFAVKPPPQAYIDGQKNLLKSYQTVYNEVIPSLMKISLAEGNPFCIAIVVYESFESANATNTGDIPMPAGYNSKGNGANDITESVLGGHYILVCGFDDNGTIAPHPNMAICRNSWGPDWGDEGYFYLPYEYLTDENLASECYALNVVGPQ
jgi:C1A family cysteine protease